MTGEARERAERLASFILRSEAALEQAIKLTGNEEYRASEIRGLIAEAKDDLAALAERVEAAEKERDEARETQSEWQRGCEKAVARTLAAEAREKTLREAFGRCSPSAPWSVKADLMRQSVRVDFSPGGKDDYPIGHLARLAAELQVIFGEQSAERLEELGTSDEVIAALSLEHSEAT